MPSTLFQPEFSPETSSTASVSTVDGPTRVNGRQHTERTKVHGLTQTGRRWLYGCLVAALGLGFSGAAFAGEPVKVKAPKAAVAAAQKAAEEILPVAEEAPEVKAQRGIVVIQRAGQVVGLGTVLSKDGRILTALSNLGSGNDLEAKFADDSVTKLKVGHHDRIWDLALLVPQSGKWTEGLASSNADPLRDDAVIRSFSTAKGKPSATPVELRTKRSLIGGDDRVLEQALELGTRINGKDVGAPLIDEKGRVVGVLGRACLPIEGKPCAPVAYGVPVSAIKSFLKSVPEDAVPPAAWLGIQGASEATPVVKGVRVLSVAKGSPASDAKLKAGQKGDGDLIVGVNGKPVTTPEELAAAVRSHSVGEKVPLTLFSNGKYKNVDVVLKAPPEMPKAAPKARLAEETTSTEEDGSELNPQEVVALGKKTLSSGKTVTIKTGPKAKPPKKSVAKPPKAAKPEKPAKPKKPKKADKAETNEEVEDFEGTD